MDYYIQKGKIDEGLAQIDAVLAKERYSVLHCM